MALVKSLIQINLEKDTKHKTVSGTYSIINHAGKVFLQVDTYGSEDREFIGKKSQSIRLNKEIALQLKTIIENTFFV